MTQNRQILVRMNGMTDISCSPICQQRQKILKQVEEEEDKKRRFVASRPDATPIASLQSSLGHWQQNADCAMGLIHLPNLLVKVLIDN
jgi:hypothetical protein